MLVYTWPALSEHFNYAAFLGAVLLLVDLVAAVGLVITAFFVDAEAVVFVVAGLAFNNAALDVGFLQHDIPADSLVHFASFLSLPLSCAYPVIAVAEKASISIIAIFFMLLLVSF